MITENEKHKVKNSEFSIAYTLSMDYTTSGDHSITLKVELQSICFHFQHKLFKMQDLLSAYDNFNCESRWRILGFDSKLIPVQDSSFRCFKRLKFWWFSFHVFLWFLLGLHLNVFYFQYFSGGLV